MRGAPARAVLHKATASAMADQARRLAEKKRKAQFRAKMDKANKRGWAARAEGARGVGRLRCMVVRSVHSYLVCWAQQLAHKPWVLRPVRYIIETP